HPREETPIKLTTLHSKWIPHGDVSSENHKYESVGATELPDDEAPNDGSKPLPKIKAKWMTGLLFCALGVALALLAHVILTVKLATKAASRGYGWGDSSSVVFHGECSTANSTATWLHVLINIIVLTLTATSSYCCQILAAPSRAGVDKAHARRVWVSIGSSSFTNIWYAPYWRKILWLLALLSSLPVQMAYNSFVYVSVNAQDFGMVIAPTNFTTTGSDWNTTAHFEDMVGMSAGSLRTAISSGSLERLNITDCADELASFQTRKNLVVAMSSEVDMLSGWTCRMNAYNDGPRFNSTEGGCSLTEAWKGGLEFDWFIKDPLSLSTESKIEYCYHQPVKATCQLECSLPIGVAVMTCIAVKLVCMLIAALDRRKEIFLTIGDALASFLRRPDQYTVNNCLMARTNKGQSKVKLTLNEYPWVSIFSRSVPFRYGEASPPQPKTVSTARRTWSSAFPPRMVAFLVLFKAGLVALGAIAIRFNTTMFGESGYDLALIGQSSWDKKVNTLYHSQFYPTVGLGFVAVVLIANIPQLIISIVYTVYNNALTRMLLAAEFNSYAVKYKPLRVSFPTGEQRSTYYLSVPYRYSIPFLAIFTLSHWLASEALSFYQIVPINIKGDFEPDRTVNGLNASSLGFRIMVVPWFITVVVFFILMLRRFKSASIPLALNCSAALSAACHRPPDDNDAAEKPVKWGEVVGMKVPNLSTHIGPGIADLETECRHCSFTSKDIVDPRPNCAYY
ncbi:hypothetical protein N7507_004988, partial [Penicillium longicatenatum]